MIKHSYTQSFPNKQGVFPYSALQGLFCWTIYERFEQFKLITTSRMQLKEFACSLCYYASGMKERDTHFCGQACHTTDKVPVETLQCSFTIRTMLYRHK